ncbi:MAG TPA: TIGR00300 family protein, partial [Actinomycetota bacterium]|nr:TIGR00300 family protein [Actinomycetota bacterium]
MPSETLVLEGHIIDSLVLPKVLDEIVEHAAEYEVLDLRLGLRHDDASFARVRVTTASDDDLGALIERL